MNKQIEVGFGTEKLKKEFESLKNGKFEDKKLREFLERAIVDLKNNPLCGAKIPQNLWPREYCKKFNINNLRKYDLPDGWRLIYTIKINEVEILAVFLEWFNHKDYERRFGY